MPNQLFKRANELPRAGDWGQSNVPAWKVEASTPRTRQIKLNDVPAALTFTLPANCRIHGEAVVYNNSAVAAAALAITVGGSALVTAAAGANATAIQAVTDTGVTRAARAVVVPILPAGVHIVLNVTEYPPVASNNAKS